MSVKLDPNSFVDPKFIGIPFKLGGKSFKGSDCVGTVILWLKEQGIDYEYDDGLGPILAHWWATSPTRFMNAMLERGRVLIFPELKKFDLLMMFQDEEINKYPGMLGVMVEDRFFLTNTEDRGSRVYMLNEYWKRRCYGGLRLHKVVEKGLQNG